MSNNILFYYLTHFSDGSAFLSKYSTILIALKHSSQYADVLGLDVIQIKLDPSFEEDLHIEELNFNWNEGYYG